MVDVKQFLEAIKFEEYYADQITHVQYFPPKKARYGTLEKPLDPRLSRWLKNNQIELWGHQAKAINLILEGKNCVISTSTASGKSLCYNLCVLHSLLQDENMTAIYIFPTKALARDQFNVLKALMADTRIKTSRVGVYDGDIEPAEKRKVLQEANIIITNPYGLHYYLSWFRQKWTRIMKNLKYIVLDEIHVYRGIFGSNFAFLLRRLKRILKSYNCTPTWILSSATINNPKKFAEKLTGETFHVIDEDDSPSGAKYVVLWDLPFDEYSQKYRSPHQETKNLFISHLKHDIQTLTFTLSRKMAELLAMWSKKALPQLSDKITSYRAGISKATRRKIESQFKNREILGISSTNALELGIDIGTLDATICSGFPGTISSFYQQIGRSGRGEELSISTLIPMQNPLDFFYIHNPEVLFGPIKEEVLISLKNKYIIKNNLCCAAKEIPLQENEYDVLGIEDKETYLNYLKELEEESLLIKRGGKYYWNGKFFPNARYGLNNLSNRSYKIILKSGNKESVLTLEDESYVFRDLHQGAVYLYEAETYLVEYLDIDNKRVYITKADVDFYTQSLKHTDITTLEILSSKNAGPREDIESFFGNVKVEHQYYSYKIIDSMTQEILARNPLENIPLIEFDTQAFWFLIPFSFQKELELKGHDLGGSIHAIEHAMIAIAPTLAQISRWDLGGVSIEFDPVKQQPIIYIYDAFRGGIGISEMLFENINELFNMTYNLIKKCKCTAPNGCPGCIISPKCGNLNEPLDKNGSLFLLEKILKV